MQPFPQRRAFAESGAATAVCRYDPTRENGVQKRPQAFLNPEIIKILSAENAQSNAEGIFDIPPLPLDFEMCYTGRKRCTQER